MNKKAWYGMVLGLLALGIWKSGATDQFTIPSIAPAEAKPLLASGKAVLVDVREKNEIEEGMIQGAVWLPLSGVQSDSAATKELIDQLDKSKEILTYCRSGKRSATVAAHLKNLGFRVKNVGGYDALIAAGLPKAHPKP